MQILEAVNEGRPLTTKFFNMGEITIAGRPGPHARPRHGSRAGARGLGPGRGWPRRDGRADRGRPSLRDAPVRRAGLFDRRRRIRLVPSPLPAIYTGEGARAYREWLSDRSFEAVSSIGGSFMPDNVEDYYLTPWDLDYGRVVKFDHDYIGRAALERMAEGPHRRKVTLIWDIDDVTDIFRAMMEEGDPAQDHGASGRALRRSPLRPGRGRTGRSDRAVLLPGLQPQRTGLDVARHHRRGSLGRRVRGHDHLGRTRPEAPPNRRSNGTGRCRSGRGSSPGRSTPPRARPIAPADMYAARGQDRVEPPPARTRLSLHQVCARGTLHSRPVGAI